MAERSTSPIITPIRRAATAIDESQTRKGPSSRFSLGERSAGASRRRSSNFSEYSINAFQSSTESLLLPKPSATGIEPSHESSVWHSAPLAFALLPALGGMLFQGGSSVITDIMLLGLAAIFLNWSVRLPWNWYHSAQSLRKKEEYSGDIMAEEESDDEALSFSQATMEEVPEEGEGETPKPATRPSIRSPAHEVATNELYTHEVLALLSCFLFPLLAAYLLHAIRTQLSRPSEGLISDYNLTVFLLASELRPMAHLVKLIQARTLHLQRVVNANPYESLRGRDTGDIKDLVRRLENLEARGPEAPSGTSTSDPALGGKQTAVLTTEVRRSLQPDLEALNRAVRRYEKRATLQAFQTESRLLDLEAKLSDAISLAAAAANNGQRGLTGITVEWLATAIVIPLQAFGALTSLPFKTIIALINFGKTSVVGRQPAERSRKAANGKFPLHSRVGERIQSRPSKR